MVYSKYSSEVRLKAVEDYFNGERSVSEIARDLSISSEQTVRNWIAMYRNLGLSAFIVRKNNQSYTKELKTKVVEEYLDGKGSLIELTARYNLRSQETLRNWVMKYNSYIELRDYDPKQEVYMAEARRNTTIEERKKIVEYCMANNKDYKVTAEQFNVSYGQVYSWVKKYNSTGEKGLIDNRGHHKSDDEVDELERLRRENKRLKRQLEEEKMTVELLKKVKEFERRRYSPKEN
ncbi:MAG: helix-turn-helix domain-containing protein [Bacteroidaceae bacterium]|nr:helix-turn-helix domain-containing protein [Bacteroidaceae bacterium]